MRDQALAEGIGRRGQYVTVHSGMEVDRYLDPGTSREAMRRELELPPDAFVLGTISRLAELKGHDDLLDALGPLMQERPDLVLLWIGDGWWRDRLLARVRDMGLTGRVRTTGLVQSEEIPRHLTAMDALAHPSYREGLPRAVVQALIGGLPAVAYDVDGTREVCRDGETGRLVAPGDREGLRDAVRSLMDDPEASRRMGRRGRELCRERFDAGFMVERLEQVYAEILAARTGPAVPRRNGGDGAG
jgi:glycosyltransferase involved in cell wall biosynthesis